MKATPLVCVTCGAAFERPGARGPVPKYCSACRADRQRAALRRSATKRRAADPEADRIKQREWRKRNPEKARAQDARRYAIHRELRLEVNRQWRRANLERSRAIAKESARKRRESDPDGFRAKRNAAAQARRDSKPEVRRRSVEATRAWQVANPDKVRDVSRRRRALQLSVAIESFSGVEIFERDDWVCQLCGLPVDREARAPAPRSPSLDHIVPLSRGGAHSRANVQLACLGCNIKKGNRPWPTESSQPTPPPS